jgi:2-polyprenyl-3-methyl-5-hydroxy-6-metoxy-1,4-benzoquinol methylase
VNHRDYIRYYQWLREHKEDYGCGASDFQVALAVFAAIKKFVRPGQTVIDCSCGRGSILRMCDDTGIACEGTEANQALIDKDLQGLPVRKLFYSELPTLLPLQWDAVVSSDVLEHLFTEDEVRTAIHDLAAISRGYLIVAVGTTPSVWNIDGRPVALHHVVREPAWWVREIERIGKIVISKPARKDAYLIVAEVKQ